MWGSIIKESDKSGIPRIQDIRRRANHSRITKRSYANESITCATESPKGLEAKIVERQNKRFKKSSKKSTDNTEFTETVGMKSTSIRFKASVLTNVSPHWQSSVSRITEPAISHPPQAGDDPELFPKREHSTPKAASKWAVAPSTPLREPGNLQWQCTILPFRRLLYQLRAQKLQRQLLILDDKQSNKQRQFLLTNCCNQHKSEEEN